MAILLTLVAVALLGFRLMHAGALWRDEAAAVQLANMPTLHDLSANFQHEAFPLPFPLLIRFYTMLFGDGDHALRCFGVAIGIALLAVAWLNSGSTGPSLFLALLGLNNLFLIWGTSLRGYGLGIVLLLLTLGLSAKAVRDPTRGKAIASMLAATASAQVLLNSLPLIIAIAGGAVVAFVLERRFHEARITCLCALVPVVSFLPYLKSYVGADWTVLLKLPISVPLLWQKFEQALADRNNIVALFWTGTVAAFLIASIWYLWVQRSDDPSELRVVRFAVVSTLLSIVAYAAFLKIVSYATRPWYYLPLIGLIAGTIEILSAQMARIVWLRAARLLIALLFLLLVPISWHRLAEPFTNVDNIARRLETAAAPNDLIVLNPWHYGPSFYRYYHGRTPWITNPLITAHRFHRYDLMKEKMMEADPIRAVEDRIRETLQSYHSVWIVGGASPPEEGLPSTLGPAPNPYLGWNGYVAFWSIELGTFLNRHVIDGEVAVDRAPNVNEDENLPVLIARGWRN